MLEVVYLWMNRHAFKRGIKEPDRLGGGHRAHPGGTTFFTENLGGTAGPGGTSFMTGVDHLGQFGHEADHFTNFAMPVGDFI